MRDGVVTEEKNKGEGQDTFRAVSLAQKTELVGQLAGAIAHQFNNVMMAVTSYAELELKKAPTAQKRSLEQVLSNAGRATALVQNLLIFTCKHATSPQTLSLNDTINGIDSILQQLIGEQIDVALNLDENVPLVHVDPVELQQMILSLCISARNTMGGHGRLTISTESTELDDSFISKNEDVCGGNYVVLSIADTGFGAGASPHHSKSAGNHDQNLEAHLAFMAVRGMVKDAEGLIRGFGSTKNGNRVKIYFPAQQVEAPVRAAKAGSTKAVPAISTILVVEDDDAVRVPAAEFLMMEGFKVLQAKTGREALQIVGRQRATVDLLITDVMMPEMGGSEVAGKLLEMYPDLRVLYMSGDADKVSSQFTKHGSLQAVLQKPFRLNKLNDKIHDLLGT